jgi:tetratricopeptide (TPR) repeat protein
MLLLNNSKYTTINSPLKQPMDRGNDRTESIKKTTKKSNGNNVTNFGDSPKRKNTIRTFSINKGSNPATIIANSNAMHKKIPIGKNYYQLVATTPKSKKIEQIESIRKTLKDEYIKITPKTLNDIKEGIYARWTRAIKLILSMDIKLALCALKVMGDMYIEFDEPDRAKNVYIYYKFLSYNLELLEDYMLAYESLGTAYKFLYKYRKAILCYKKQIELAWKLNDKYSELRAYDNIGLQYFYLNNKEKAKYYHKRFIKGISEGPESDMRIGVVNKFNDKNFNIVANEKAKVKKNNDELKTSLE